MKRKHWIGGVLLVMALWGITGCGKAEAPPAGQMVDGPGMMYTPPPAAWSCPSCRTENEGSFCTGCGLVKPLTCKTCGWQPKPGTSAPAYCPECGNRLK